MSDQTDILIIGGGAMGLATAYQLSKTDRNVVLLEQDAFFNDHGSSAGMSRQFRLQYSQKYMSRLVQASIPYWNELEEHSDQKLITNVGSLWFGSPDMSSQEGGIQSAMKVMNALDIPYDQLDAGDIEDRFPFQNIPDHYSGFFQKDGGIINLKATMKTMYQVADDADNVTLKSYAGVHDIDSRPDGEIHVSYGDDGHVVTDKLVMTAGAYTNKLLEPLGLHIDLDIWEMTSAYYEMQQDDVNFPTWFVFQEPQDTSLFYGFPEVSWAHPGYIRVSPDIPDRVLNDPDKRTGVPSQQSLDYTTEWVQKHMGPLGTDPEFTSTCMIALSNRGKELLLDTPPDWVHNNEDITIYTAGWAAKFVPLIGQILADRSTKGKSEYDTDHFQIEWQKVRGELSPAFETGIEEDLTTDVAIVGAGAAGLYSGYRLVTGDTKEGNHADPDVDLFEMSDRIGGRLESVRLPGMNVVGELGGMRYMTEQQIVTSLIEDVFSTKYGLNPVDFPMGEAHNHLFYLRKQRFFASRFEEASITGEEFETRYVLDERFKGTSPDEIFNEVIRDVLEADGYSLEKIQNAEQPRKEWNRVKKNLKYRFEGPYEDKYVYEIGFWNLLKDQTSEECYKYLSQAGGYYSNTINWNAAEAFPYMAGDFSSKDVKYRTIEGGYDQVLTCLASSFIQQGGRIHTRNELKTFRRTSSDDDEYRYVLTFYNEEKDETWEVRAKDMILAMPRRSLERLDSDNFFFDSNHNETLQKEMSSVIIEPSYKILLGFEEPWWKHTLGAKAGESITDLPMRQCYYFGVDPENGHSLFMASYNDMRTVPFWQALELDECNRYDTRETRLVRAKNVPYPDYRHAPEEMVNEVMKQIRELHGSSIEVPAPYTSAYKDWTKDPYGGGYHAWKAGTKVWEIMPDIRQPMDDERIFIVGEAYSDQQGWVEGAFCVAEHVMREQFDRTCPDWLDENYYLGW